MYLQKGKLMSLPASTRSVEFVTPKMGFPVMQLKLPISIFSHTRFDDYRKDARAVIDLLTKPEKDIDEKSLEELLYTEMNPMGLDTFLAALIYEVVEANYLNTRLAAERQKINTD